MEVLICIDDTDNHDSPGTGKLAAALAEDIRYFGWGECSFVTRHQLYVHPDVPYTSHNSAMCFAAELDEGNMPALIEHAGRFLALNSATGSDPGLCVAVRKDIPSAERLMEFGLSAKRSVLTKEDAYGLSRAAGVHLSEHGGTGQGVIGALAGVGLRLGGNDGRLRGRLEIGMPGSVLRVRQIMMSQTVGSVRAIDGMDELGPNEEVVLGEKVKAVYRDGMPVLLVARCEVDTCGTPWRTCTKEELKGF